MTISSFCHDQLRERGPLSLEVLAALAADAGVTASRFPESSVRSAIAHNAAALPGGRWATPLQLLEGRWLTTRGRLSGAGYSGDHARHDLAPLHFLLRSAPIELATGGVLQRASYGQDWKQPPGWPGVECCPDQLLGLRLRDGVLHVEILEETRSMRDAGQALALALGRLDKEQRYWHTAVHTVEDNLLTRLWELTAAGSEVLTHPAPPLSECVPALAVALREEREALEEQGRHWRPQLDLPEELRYVAIDAARTDDVLFQDWLDRFVAKALRALDNEAARESSYDDRVRPLRRLF